MMFQSAEQPTPTLVDVFSKALDMAKSGVAQGYELAKQAAPQLWQLARRQTIIEGIQGILGIILIIVIVISCWRWAKWYDSTNDRRPDYSHQKFDKGDARTAAFCLRLFPTIIGLILAFILEVDVMNYLLNPDYWTLIRIVDLLKGNH